MTEADLKRLSALAEAARSDRIKAQKALADAISMETTAVDAYCAGLLEEVFAPDAKQVQNA